MLTRAGSTGTMLATVTDVAAMIWSSLPTPQSVSDEDFGAATRHPAPTAAGPQLDTADTDTNPQGDSRSRPAHSENTLARIRAWRAQCPDLTLRSTFIVGFPGETEGEFAQLLAWLDEAELDRVGCFKYSPVEGAAANALPGHVAPELQEERYARFMERAAAISRRRLAQRVGRHMRVLVDAVQDGTATARSEADAPQIDGVVRIEDAGKLRPGDWAEVRIVAADDYDLTGRLA